MRNPALVMMAISMMVVSWHGRSDDKLGRETQKNHEENVAAYGENILDITPGSDPLPFGGPPDGLLTAEDADAISKKCPSVIAAAPFARVYGNGTWEVNGRKWHPATILATKKAYLAVRDWENLQSGKGFSEEDERDGSAVCLLGKTVVENLFQGALPIGQRLDIKGTSFTVLGVLAKKGCDSILRDQDDIVLIPWKALQKIKGPPAADATQIWAKAATADKMQTATSEIRDVLRTQHQIKNSGRDDFTITDLIKSREEVQSKKCKRKKTERIRGRDKLIRQKSPL